jgi:8-oxo-dGTP diphosphatase
MSETSGRQLAQVDVHLILRRGGDILLGQRTNTGFGDGCWHPPSGHGEDGESAVTSLIREAQEEIGITIARDNVRFVHLLHQWTGSARTAIFFEVTDWDGEPVNNEPDKCAGWEWFPVGALPDQMIDYARQALTLYLKGEAYSERGWRE